jgi:hypothetical protein
LLVVAVVLVTMALVVGLVTRVAQQANFVPAQWPVALTTERLLRSQRVVQVASGAIPLEAMLVAVVVVTTVAVVRHQQMRVHRVDRAIPHPLLSVR